MFSAIFEVLPKPSTLQEYLDRAKKLKPVIESIDGFIDNERFKRKAGKPLLINTEMFKFYDLKVGLAAVFFHIMMHTSYLLLSAVFLQTGLGISPLTSGLYFIAPSVLFTVASVIASRKIPRYGTLVLQAGIAIIVITLILQIIYFKTGVRIVILFLLQALYGLGNGFVLPSLLNITLRSLPPKHAGAAAGVYSTVQQTSSALGICLIGGLFYNVYGHSHKPVCNFIKIGQYICGNTFV